MKAKQHAQGINTLEGYEFDCANVSGDSFVNMKDYIALKQHAQGINLLWEN